MKPLAAKPQLRSQPMHSQPVLPTVATLLRSLAAMALAMLLSPIIAPSVFIRLPDCLPVRLLERLSVLAVSLVTAVAGVHVVLRARSDAAATPRHAPLAWLPAPVAREWTSPLPHGRRITTYDQPGRWMSDAQLAQLRATLRAVARSSVGCVPTHRLFDAEHARAALSNRVVAVAADDRGPLGFTAMVYLPCDGDIVIHLGLTMMSARGRGQRLQSPLFGRSLVVPHVNLCRLSYTVTNLGASPAGVGSVSDYFFDCFPTYDDSNARTDYHLRVALGILSNFRHEFGCSVDATFDPNTFVVHKSNDPNGGGTHEFIRKDGSAVSSHRNPLCNQFVDKLLDYRAGDEIFQVASVNVLGTIWKYFKLRTTTAIRAK